MSLSDCYDKKTGRILRTPISDAFCKWRKTASKEQLQAMCDSGNALAAAQRMVHKQERRKV